MRIILSLTFLILASYANGEVIKILSGRRVNANNGFIRSQKFYRTFQEPIQFRIQGPSDFYVKVTGLNMAFHHTVPLLYKVNFYAVCWNSAERVFALPRLMVDNYLVYNDKFVRNTEYRHKSIPGFENLFAFDQLGAGHYGFPNAPLAMTIEKNEWIYLAPGLHSIDVAIRTVGTAPVYINFGVLSIELVEYSEGANLGGLVPVNVTSIN